MAILDISPLVSSRGGGCGVPTIDSSGRLWAIWTGGTRSLPTVEYSDDYGSTWTLWREIPQTSDSTLTSLTIIRDTNGNIYFNSARYAVEPKVYGISRLDAATGEVSRCFDFYVFNEWQADPLHYAVMALDWSWTVDDSGNIYIGQYANEYWNGTAYVEGGLDGFQAQYIWKGNSTGTSWQRCSTFVDEGRYFDSEAEAWVGSKPNEMCLLRHMHSVHCSPYDGRIWVNIGDGRRHTYTWDGNPNSTPTKITSPVPDNMGMTGLTFTTERVYASDDNVGSMQKVWRETAPGSGVMQVMYDPPTKWECPAYYLRAVGPNELWMTVYNDAQLSYARSSLVRLTKTSPTGAWSATSILEADGHVHAQNPTPYAIAHDGRGVLPDDTPFVYFNIVGHAGTAIGGLNPGAYRIQRAELPTFTFDLAAAVDAIYDAPPATDAGAGTDDATAPHAIALVPSGTDSGAATDDGVPEVVQAAESIVFDLAQRIEALYDVPTLVDAGAGTDQGVPVAVETPVYVVPPGTDSGRGSDMGMPGDPAALKLPLSATVTSRRFTATFIPRNHSARLTNGRDS